MNSKVKYHNSPKPINKNMVTYTSVPSIAPSFSALNRSNRFRLRSSASSTEPSIPLVLPDHFLSPSFDLVVVCQCVGTIY